MLPFRQRPLIGRADDPVFVAGEPACSLRKIILKNAFVGHTPRVPSARPDAALAAKRVRPREGNALDGLYRCIAILNRMRRDGVPRHASAYAPPAGEDPIIKKHLHRPGGRWRSGLFRSGVPARRVPVCAVYPPDNPTGFLQSRADCPKAESNAP